MLKLLFVLLMLLMLLLSPNPLVADIGGNTGGAGAGAVALPLELPRGLLLQSRAPLLRGAAVAAGTAGAAGAGETLGRSAGETVVSSSNGRIDATHLSADTRT